MKVLEFSSFICLILVCSSLMAQHSETPVSYKQLENTHDILLSPWGPYSKKYAGISHIPNMQSGMRFDISVLPGYYRNRVMVPNVLFESGYYPWEISDDMSKITYRYELEWKDKVYVDVTYTVLDSSTVLVAMHPVNNTALPQVLQLNMVSSINYPDVYPNMQVRKNDNITWKNAVNYQELKFALPRPSDDLVYDGWIRGEARDENYLDGHAVAKGFGATKGDKVSYTLNVLPNQLRGVVAFRYRMPENTQTTLRTEGLLTKPLTLKGTGKFEMLQLPYVCPNPGVNSLTLISEGGSSVELNGFFIAPEQEKNTIALVKVEKNFAPKLINTNQLTNIRLKYTDVTPYYGIAWNYPSTVVREFRNDELDIYFRKYVHEHNQLIFNGNQLGDFTNVFMRPVELAPMSDQTIYGLVCNGDEGKVNEKLTLFNASPTTFIQKIKTQEDPYKDVLNEGKPYIFSQKMMRAALLSNIVYPIYTQGQYIRHFTPGKWWNSLYTWDSGFEALALGQVDISKSIQNLNAYTTPVGSQSAFIHHGSPVPVQAYAFYDLWNKTQSKELLSYFYPRLKQYYEFMAGKSGSSTTASMNSKLLKTWDYFYNSGGWDDYPPQKAVRDQKLEKTVSPVITTAQCIRFAKILRKSAQELGQQSDIKQYDQDIKTFSNALQTIAWDEQSGYFSYVVHDSLKNPKGFLRHSDSGKNYNMGLDGAYPLFSGICTPKQQDTLLDKIFSDKHMWTPAGICVVDQAAPYYRIDGYWNGAVWMSHQWFMWKTMLDLGRTDLAFKIADKALHIWKTETDETYFTFEHFFAKTGRGAGWHQFSALSTPVMMWFSAYYKPGTVTTGFEVWIDKQSFNSDHSGYEAQLSFDQATTPHKRSMLVCLNPSLTYKVFINGLSVNLSNRYNGLLEIPLPESNESCSLSIKPI
jgi:hypothetical protein